MKRVVNGAEADLDPTAASVEEGSDRLWVKGAGGAHSSVVVRQGEVTWVSFKGRVYKVEKPTVARSHSSHSDGDVRAPMPGLVVNVLVAEGQQVQKGQKLLVLEAMKTQQTFVAPFDGVVATVSVEPGQQVEEGAALTLVEEV